MINVSRGFSTCLSYLTRSYSVFQASIKTSENSKQDLAVQTPLNAYASKNCINEPIFMSPTMLLSSKCHRLEPNDQVSVILLRKKCTYDGYENHKN